MASAPHSFNANANMTSTTGSVTQSSRSLTQAGNTGTTSRTLNFYQAMRDFKQMFPTMDDEIIEAVLRANNGEVDATIDQLLTMNIDIDDDVPPVEVGYLVSSLNS